MKRSIIITVEGGCHNCPLKSSHRDMTNSYILGYFCNYTDIEITEAIIFKNFDSSCPFKPVEENHAELP